nr:protein CASC1-like isoform X2 [Physcomitrium patens]|eukprot:XP_024373059.1 protein CASC1-like isoform X2 [Physcomitrella patens]
MPPKLTPKERAAAKKAERAQFEEIARRMEQERLIKEALQIVRKELEEKLAYEADQRWLEAERERLAAEADSIIPYYKRQEETREKIEAAATAKKEWELFMDTSGLPQAAKEATLNTYLENGYQSLDLDYNEVLKSLVNIYKISNEAVELALQEDQKGNVNEATKYRGFMLKLEKMGKFRMDQTTNYLLQKSYAVYRDTEKSIVTERIGDWKLALWINHVKNPRHRLLELPELDIYIKLPKSFALANAAIRIYHQTVNPLYKSKNAYMPLGGVFVIDVLGIPVESKLVKQWTLENLATSTQLQYLGYPIPAVGQSAPSPQQLLNVLPFEIDIIIPKFIIHWEPNPEIGWWDSVTETWQTEGVSEIEYTPENFKLLFHTTKAKPHAIVQSRVREYPYKSWNIRPTSEKTGVLTLKTAKSNVIFNVGDGWCQLLEPKMPMLKHILSLQLPPKVLLQQLSNCGLQLMPEDDDAQYSAVKIKDAELELQVCRDAALAIPAFTLASSPLNKTKDSKAILLRIQEIPEPLYPPTLEKSKVVKTIYYTPKGSTLIDHSDKLPGYKEVLEAALADKYAKYHSALLVTLRGNCFESSQNKMDNGNVAFTECVSALMYALRLFTFGP